MIPITENTLFYGDNLQILREYIPDESVDLIYLDPPFNSKRTYNVLFRDESGKDSEAQIAAFEDTWHWDAKAEETYYELINISPEQVVSTISSFREFIGTNQMMAYLVMMAIRLVELHRVLKKTGSLYLHCDATASHYLKILLDVVFGADQFRNEILWKRSTPRGNASRKLAVSCDTILFYTKTGKHTWNRIYGEYRPEYIKKYYNVAEKDGRLFQPTSLLGHKGVNPVYEWRGITKPWRYPEHRLEELEQENKLYWPPKGKIPRLKRYLDEQKGQPLQSLWDDIPPINSQAVERLGYPTQKPLTLLERIVTASSNEGDTVLDPFCGCGTTVAAAQKLDRKWIGIDITHLSIALLKYRLKDMFKTKEKEDYKVVGEPQSLLGAKQLAEDNRYQFQWWALSLVRAKPLGATPGGKKGKKGADKGIDGIINFIDDSSGKVKRILVQVKSGHVHAGDIRDLKGTVEREKAAIRAFITLKPATKPMKTEATSTGFYYSEGWSMNYPKIQILTIEELLNGVHVNMPPYNKTFKEAKKVSKGDPEVLKRLSKSEDEVTQEHVQDELW